MTPALLCLLLLGADDALPPGHPPIPPRSDGGQRAAPAAAAPGAPLPPGHPAISPRQDGGPLAAPAAVPPGAPLPPGHPDVKRGAAPPSARDLLQQLDATPDLKTRPKPFEVSAALGNLYFTQGRYADAVVYFRQSLETAAPLRALALAERRRVHGTLPVASAAGCRSGAEVGVVEARAKERAAAGDHATAAACALVALGPALEAGGLLGNALFLGGDAAGALTAYGWVLEVEPTQPEALYGRAGVRFDTRPDDVASLRLVRKDLSALLGAWPQIPQAPQARALLARTDELIAAGGATRFAASHPKPAPAPVASAAPRPADVAPPSLSPETVDAIRNTERTPELEKGLAALVEQGEDALAQGQYQAALDAYRRVMPFQPDSGRTKAGMAWALVGLNRQPMADRVWGVAVGTDPGAVDALGDLLAKKGNAKEARAIWAKLAATAPDYARRVNLEKKVK